jgi:alpha-L-fucosidase
VSSGPRRDLLGDLATAVRETDVKFGIYFSLYEWFNPLYQADVDGYVGRHVIPQFKDVVSRYAPAVIFSDGEWEHPSATWRSTELLHWLFTAAPGKDEVVINDRWGQETRHQHGGYYTTEYGSGLANAAHPWEESRGMAYSYGYNRAESFGDYTTSREFVLMLADIVSRGGNFLLDIGPTADGRIPVIMQQRLLDIGAWLEVNGEAIYGTTTWQVPCQWTPGEVREPERGEFKSGYDIVKLTLDPEPGFARKEILFTRKPGVLYAICPTLPDATLAIRDLTVPPAGVVTLLGHDAALTWRQDGTSVVVELPRFNPGDLPCDHAWTLKITGVP